MDSGLLLAVIFYPMAGALISGMIGRKTKTGRDYFAVFIVVTEFFFLLAANILQQGAEISAPAVCGMGLHLKIDGFRGLYSLIAGFMWMMTILFSGEYFAHYRNRNRYYLFQLVTLGAVIGVFLSADLYTTFIFFEIMSFTSYVWVAQDEKIEALRAAETYLVVAMIGGMALLMGICLLFSYTGTLEIKELYEACKDIGDRRKLYAAGGCMLVGFGAKAGVFPLHIWLPKAHPVAPAPASALLSGILTKLGVYGILIISCYILSEDKNWGVLILCLGVITMFLGAFLAVFSVDLKRTLACSSMSQIGFILVGTGMMCLLGTHGSLAAGGIFLHMMNHSLIKLVLFMAAGVVFMNLHKLDLNDIRGFGRGKPFLNFAFLMGALGIGGLPFWNGYVSKTLLHESIIEYSKAPAYGIVEWMFLIIGGLTAAYMLKLYIVLFVEKNDAAVQKKYDEMNGHYMNKRSMFAIGGSAAVLPVLGMAPGLTMIPIAEGAREFFLMPGSMHVPRFWGFECLKGGLISIGIGIVIYLLIIRKLFIKKEAGKEVYADLWPVWLDLENLVYRPFFEHGLLFIGSVLGRACDSAVDGIVVLLRRTLYKDAVIPYRTGSFPKLETVLGTILDKGESYLKRQEEAMSHRWSIRRRRLAHQESRDMIRFSLSYGLSLSGIGLIFVLIYLFSN